MSTPAEKWVHREGNVYFDKMGTPWIGDLIIANHRQDDEEWIAAVWQNGDVEKQTARSRLIAAAPQLLEALNWIAASGSKSVEECMNKAAAAIKAAEGGE